LSGQAQIAVPAAPAQPLTIDKAIQEALDHNLTILAERLNVTIAEARLITARLRPNPVFSSGLDYQDILGTGFYSNPQTGAGPPEYNFRLDYILERGGKRQRRIEVAENAKAVVQLQLLDATRTLILDVQNAFVDVLLAKESLAVAQDSLKALNAVISTNENRVRAGDLAPVELFRAQVAALQFQNQVRAAQLRVRTASNRLQTVMGRTVRTPDLDVAGTIRRDSAPPELDELRARAVANRPDVQALRRDQARSVAELRSQIAQGKVDFTVGTMFHRQYGYANGNAMGFFFSAPLPVFNRNQGEIERARREGEQIAQRIRAIENNVRSEVENAYETYRTAQATLENVEKDMLGKARQVREIMDYSYRRGEASLIEFLDAQRTFNETLQVYNEARAEYARNLYLIDSVTGISISGRATP
jgi:cobalt-zinc-cadmium efflux system outer membrane protein